MSAPTLAQDAAHAGEPSTAPPFVAVLPRVNLLPPEIEELRRFRRVQTGLGGAVLAAVGIVALLYVGATGAVSDAQGELDDATGQHSRLQAESAKYRDVTAVYARAAAAERMLTEATGEEVRWSRLLDSLSLNVPDNVWVKNVTFTQTPAAAAPGAAGQPGIGTATFTGVGFSHDDVAVWLESLAGQTGYANPTFSSSTESLLGARRVVTFTSTATVTGAALRTAPGTASAAPTPPAGVPTSARTRPAGG